MIGQFCGIEGEDTVGEMTVGVQGKVRQGTVSVRGGGTVGLRDSLKYRRGRNRHVRQGKARRGEASQLYGARRWTGRRAMRGGG